MPTAAHANVRDWGTGGDNADVRVVPHADDAVIEGADSLAFTHSHAIAPAIATFMRDNPMGHDGN